MSRKNIMVIFGGTGMEYHAGCKAYSDVIENIDTGVFNVIKLGITQQGKWFLTNASSEEIKDGISWTKRTDNIQAFISPGINKKTVTIIKEGCYHSIPVDVAFPLIAGYGGEDGRLQALLDLADIPYIGSGMISSACGLDKELTRMFADICGLKQPQCVIIHKSDFEKEELDYDNLIPFEYPVFVKPANGGTSVGVTRATSSEELVKALSEGFKYDDKNLVEEEVRGTEIKVALLGNHDIQVGSLCQIRLPEGSINDYETKQNSVSEKTIPAGIDENITKEIKQQAENIYKKMGCRGFARVDFFLTESGQIYFNEINTIPGLGRKSIYSQMFENAGISYGDMIKKIIATVDV